MKCGKQDESLDRNRKRMKAIRKYERMFAFHQYEGKGKDIIGTLNGSMPVAVAAPYAVRYMEEGGREIADCYTGGLSWLLAREAGCHAIYAGKAYSGQQEALAAGQIRQYLDEKKIKVLIDLGLTDSIGDSVAELWTACYGSKTNEKYGFVEKAIRYTIEYEYKDLEAEGPQSNQAGEGTGHGIVLQGPAKTWSAAALAAQSITTPAPSVQESEDSGQDAPGILYMYLGISKSHWEPPGQERFMMLVNTLVKAFSMLSHMDWNARAIDAYRLRHSSRHKPQDKIELCLPEDGSGMFKANSLLNINSYCSGEEKVRLHKPAPRTGADGTRHEGRGDEAVGKGEYIYLTNRLIEQLFKRAWMEAGEDRPGLEDAPVIVCENPREAYPMGLPKANKIDGVFFSRTLYDCKKEDAKLFDYVIFNRYTDSMLHIDFEKADYGDPGKESGGQLGEKVMVPRYYKRLLGYLDYPLDMLRSEEYEIILDGLRGRERKSFEACYEAIDGETFHALKRPADETDAAWKAHLDTVIEVENRLGLREKVEILRVRKEAEPKKGLPARVLHMAGRLKDWLLDKAIGKAEFLLKAVWTNETDDKYSIARLSPSMMSLLGVSDNDKIVIRFGKRQEILRVLASEALTDYQIGIPARARKELGMNSINDIVSAWRDMGHMFRRHSQEQMIAILGTLLTVLQMPVPAWLCAVLCAALIPVIIYFVLNEERVKVK